MEKIFFTIIKTVLAILFCFTVSFSYCTDVEVSPYQIFFDCYTNSYQHDALSVSDSDGDPITGAEWYDGDQLSTPAYIVNQNARKIKVVFGSINYSGIAHLIVNLSYASGGTKGIGTFCKQFIANYNFAVGSEDTIEFQLTGDLPDAVGKHNFTWKWDIYAIPVNATGYCANWEPTNTAISYFTVLAEPKAPMAKPWEGVLDIACDFASGEKTAINILKKLISEFYSSGVTYNSSDSYYTTNEFVGEHVFYLSTLLAEWGTNVNNVTVDCQDCSMFFSILSSSLGAPLNKTCRISPKYDIEFDTNKIIPIGLAQDSTYTWNFHQIAWDNNVYDPTIKVYGYQDPPTNLPFSTYQGLVLAPNENWTLESSFILGQNDPVTTMPTRID